MAITYNAGTNTIIVTGYYNPKSAFRLQVKLSKAKTVLFGLGQPILNLNATDPENALVLPL